MKRFLVIVIALLHLASATGASVRSHYCMGRLIETALAPHFDADGDGHACSKCGMEKKSSEGCCEEHHKFIKDASDKAHQHALHFAFDAVAVLPATIAPVYGEVRSDFFAAVRAVPVSNAPPLEPPLPIYLQVCSLLI